MKKPVLPTGFFIPTERDTSGWGIESLLFKLLFMDVGLLSSVLGLRLTDFMPDTDLTLAHSGAIAEQYVGRHLLYGGERRIKPALCYWNKLVRGSSSEVDYLIRHGDLIIPAEVKAGKTGRLKSLHMFVQASPALRLNADIPS